MYEGINGYSTVNCEIGIEINYLMANFASIVYCQEVGEDYNEC